MDELRLAVRRLTKRPAASLVSIVTLACAIGAAAATWSLLSAVLLRPLPVKDADRLVVAGTVMPSGRLAGMVLEGFLYPRFAAVRDSGIFEDVSAEWSSPPSLLTSTGTGERPVPANIGFVTVGYFDLLGLQIPLGRGFTSTDDRRGAPPVAILTDAYWRRTFDGRVDVIGRTITVQGKTVTIVGVAPAGFRGVMLSRPMDFYLPFHTIADMAPGLMNYFAEPGQNMSPTAGTKIVARLRSDVSVEQALARLSSLDAMESGAGTKPVYRLTPINLSAIPYSARAGMSQFARLLGSTVALLLLIGGGTVGMLLLIRTEARREELALCVALGASRGRLARGIVMEGSLLAAAGALLAVPVSWWLFRGSGAFQLPGGINIGRLELAVDARAVAAAGTAALLATILISLIAATFGLTASAAESLRSRGGSTPRMARRRTRAALVTAQVAVAMVLVAGAGLFARSMASALSLNGGLGMDRVVTGELNLRPYGYTIPRATAFFDDLQARLRGNASIESVAFSASRGGMGGKLGIDGVLRQFPTDVWFTAVDENYFRTLGVRATAGRDFTDADRMGAPLVAIVSESFARQLADDGGNPLGRRVTMPFSRAGQPPDVIEVVGVVGDVITRVSVLQPLDMYLPMRQSDPSLWRMLAVRTAGEADGARREIMSAIKAADSAVVPGTLLTLEEQIGRQMAAQRFGALVLGTLGIIAVLLTILGTYVLAESMAATRMREMGIRAALGASRRQLGAIVMAETGRLVGFGLVVGLGLAWLGANTIRAFLFQVQPFDPLTLTAVAGTILTLALIVSVRPALRAARVDLGTVLKDQ